MNSTNSRALFASIAVGAGFLVGAAGILIYEHFFAEKRRLLLQKEVFTLETCMSKIQYELDTLKALQKKGRGANKSITYSVTGTNRTDADSEMISAIGGDSEEEFFDFSDDEDKPNLAEIKKDFVGDKYEEVDRMMEGLEKDKIKAYGMLLDLLEKDEKNPDILWRLAKCCHVLGKEMELQENTRKKQEYIEKGIQFAKECLEVAPRSSDSHKWYAICIGARCEYQTNREKVSDGLEFIKHIEEALTIVPDDPTLHYLHGRYKYEVASLSWLERKLASAFFGEIPEGTYEEAVRSLQRAEEFSREPWKENRVLLAKSLIKVGDVTQAMHWLDKAEEGEIITPEDHVADAEIKKMKKHYGSHRGLP